MASFPITGMMDKESAAGATAKTIKAKTITCDSIGATQGIEAGMVFGNDIVAMNSFAVSNLPSATARFLLPASSATISPMRLTPGVAPTTPVDGDIWYDGTNLKMRVGGTTKTFTLA